MQNLKKYLYYRNLFKDYPDVVELPDLRKMLGGVGDSFARKLVQTNRVRHFLINRTYYIPKIWVIEYVLSDFYKEDKKRLKVQI